MKFLLITALSFVLAQNLSAQSCSIAEVVPMATETDLCAPNSGTTITTDASETGITYYLIDQANGNVIDGPISGTGSSLTFNTGAISTTTTYAVIGEESLTSLDFDGIDDNVSCGTALNFTGDFTLEAWIKQDAIQNWPAFMANIDYVPNQGYWLGTNDGGEVEFYISNNSWVTGTTNIADGTWHHVAAVYESGNGHVYVDGVLESTEIMATSLNTSLPFTIGTDSDGFLFTGSIDDVRVWDVGRSQAEIAGTMDSCLAGNESNLQAYYTFEDGLGAGTLTDLTGNGNDGTLNNMDPSTAWTMGTMACCSIEMSATTTVNVTSGYATIEIIDASTLGANAAADAYQWIDCDNGNQVVNGEASVTFNGTPYVNYAVITTIGSCTDTSDCMMLNVGNAELENEFITNIYPNPSQSGIFTVLTNSKIESIQVIDHMGKIVGNIFNFNDELLNLTHLESGSYILIINTKNSTGRQSISILH